ncbi:MAG TPA: DEAD/DEAH box helicase [Candidatus Nanopelagicaceae bacterium]|nr:DEAD/DEAH box helicase [Candidatus Nanopelagicaceae bacterium]
MSTCSWALLPAARLRSARQPGPAPPLGIEAQAWNVPSDFPAASSRAKATATLRLTVKLFNTNEEFGAPNPELGRATTTSRILIAGYPLLQNAKTAGANLKAISEWDPDGLVCDESHNLKTSARKAARSGGALTIAKDLMARHPDAPIYLLSGTPMPNKPKELFSQLEIMGRVNDFGGWQTFARTYCGLHYEIGHEGKQFPSWDGVTNPADLNRKLRSTCMVRRRKVDVTPELGRLLDADRPPVYIDTDQTAMALYRETERSLSGFLAQRAIEIANELGMSVESAAVADRLQRIEAAASLVKLNELRKLAAKAKLPEAISWIGEAIEASKGQGMNLLDGGDSGQPGKVIVFAHHQEVVQGIAAAFGAPTISGLETGMAERQEVIDRFQNDPQTRLVVCSFGAGAQGITLTAASQVIFVELPWRPMDIDQAIARAWRIGQTQVVTPTFLLAADTVDEDMLSLIRQKAGDFEAVIEGGPNGGPKGRSIEGELLVRLARKGSGASTTAPTPVDLSPVRPAANTEPASRPATFPARQAPRLSRTEIAGTLAIPQLRPLLLPLRPQG